MTGFRAAAVQMTGTPFEVAANTAQIERYVRRAAEDDARLVVLPELCDTGYTHSPDLRGVSTEIPGRATDLLCGLAAELDLTIVTAISARTGHGKLQDVGLVVTPEGIAAQGAKRLLWGNEPGVFVAGAPDELILGDTPVGRVGVAICYESGFPEAARELALHGAQIIAVPAAFGLARLHAWKLATRSRALENGCFLIAANSSGRSDGFDFCGHSTLVDPDGERMALLADGSGIVTATLDPALVAAARTTIPYLRDVRPVFPTSASAPSSDPDAPAAPQTPLPHLTRK
ncbi:carbon-nitrogen hydrolase family protein [Nocardia sp. NPDC003345]